MRNTIPVAWLIALAGSLTICSPTALGKTRGKFVFSETTWNYEVGKDVKPGVDGLIITSDKKHVFSLVTLQQGNDGSATILFIHFNQENVGTKTVTFPRSAGRIMLEPATAGSTTRQGVAFTTMTFDQKTGKWSDLGPEGSRAVRWPLSPTTVSPILFQ